MRILAFEDMYDIKAILVAAGVDESELIFEQRWNSDDALEHIKTFNPEILLLDHFMPPKSGYEVLNELLNSKITRPNIIVAMSSEPSKNQAMVELGANYGIIKFSISELDIWPVQSSS